MAPSGAAAGKCFSCVGKSLPAVKIDAYKLCKGQLTGDESMKYRNINRTLEKPSIPTSKLRKRFECSLEYQVLAQLTLQHFQQDGVIDFEKLLSIPSQNRVPGLIAEFGMKRMHTLITVMLKEFCRAIKLPKSRKLTETGNKACACDLIIAAQEDYLSLEDVVLFFEGAKEGQYGKFKNIITHFSIMEKLEMYRNDRYKIYCELKEKKEAILKTMGPVKRTEGPISINSVLKLDFGDFDGLGPAA